MDAEGCSQAVRILACPEERFMIRVVRRFLTGAFFWLAATPALFGVDEEEALLFSPVAEAPEWRLLDAGQGKLKRGEFEARLGRTFDPQGALRQYLLFDEGGVTLFRDTARTQPLHRLTFAPEGGLPSFPAVLARGVVAGPLGGKVICLDPGHIGGDWADLEERTFRIGRDQPVVEGELNLRVCRNLQKRLEEAGARVVWTHEGFHPTTALRPSDLYPEAIEYLLQGSRGARLPRYTANRLIRWNAELLFYRSAEISARARRVNEELRPDLTLCIHFNAAPWPGGRVRLTSANRLVLFAHGSYTAEELAFDDQKFHLMRKLLEGSTPVELGVGAAIGERFREGWGFRPESYAGSGYSHATGASPYVWYRNLIANRMFDGPVVFVEGPFMNDREMYRWIQSGEYGGVKAVAGRNRGNVFREYANLVADGVIGYFRKEAETPAAFTNYSP
jgi:N-acetylmuramoyl-L-alanine amidase